MEAPEEVLLELNALAEGHKYLRLGAFSVSDDGNLLAYALDTTGFNQFTLHVKDLRTGQLGPRVGGIGALSCRSLCVHAHAWLFFRATQWA